MPGLRLIALVGSDRLLHLIVATSFAELVELKPETEAHPTQIKADGDDSKLWLHYSLRRQPGRALSALDRLASPKKLSYPTDQLSVSLFVLNKRKPIWVWLPSPWYIADWPIPAFAYAHETEISGSNLFATAATGNIKSIGIIHKPSCSRVRGCVPKKRFIQLLWLNSI